MSNALAIAAVTAVLMDLLQNTLIDHKLTDKLGEIKVSALPPDRIDKTGENPNENQLNLFLYRVTPNIGWRNQDLPSHSASGDRLTNPHLALDLHYLLTAYGLHDLDAEILLGYAMLVMHETPVLTRDAIRRSLAPTSPVTGSILPAAMQTLVAADLADQVEQIRIVPEYLELDSMTNLWSAQQTGFRPSAGYLASVVLIESHRSTREALPVRDRMLYSIPFAPPVIEKISSAAGPNQPILPTQPLIIYGRQLAGQVTLVRLGDQELTLPTPVSPTQIQVNLPTQLHAGVQGVQVVHLSNLGQPALPHRGVESNIMAFVLHPVIQKDPASHDRISKTNQTVDNGLYAADVSVFVQPKVGQPQRVYLLLNRLDSPPNTPAGAYSFPANAWADPNVQEIEEVGFKVGGVEPGTYLVRVQVDGAASPVAETGGVYSGPVLVFP